MTALTVNVPDELAARWKEIPEEDRDMFALADIVDEFYQAQFYPTSEEDLKAIGEALADADAGRVVDGETFFAELEALRQSLNVTRK